jgi:hypothetical protein
VPATEATAAAICPIAGVGADAATPAIDTTNETSGPPGDVNIDGTKSFAAAYGTTGKTIADQLTARRMSWKSYQESLPSQGADRVNNSDGTFTDQTVFSAAEQALGEKDSNVVSLYAVKHNPFVYFKSVQESPEALHNVVGFDGIDGLYGDLRSGDVPSFSFIAPNQCNDQHGRGNAGPWCNYDPNDQGTQSGLNPGLIKLGDATVQKLVTAIKGSPAWEEGNNAIVIVWDENDYSKLPTTNKVVAIVDTNRGGHDEHSEQTRAGHQSNRFYTHFSLLKTRGGIQPAVPQPCLRRRRGRDVRSVLIGRVPTPPRLAMRRVRAGWLSPAKAPAQYPGAFNRARRSPSSG